MAVSSVSRSTSCLPLPKSFGKTRSSSYTPSLSSSRVSQSKPSDSYYRSPSSWRYSSYSSYTSPSTTDDYKYSSSQNNYSSTPVHGRGRSTDFTSGSYKYRSCSSDTYLPPRSTSSYHRPSSRTGTYSSSNYSSLSFNNLHIDSSKYDHYLLSRSSPRDETERSLTSTKKATDAIKYSTSYVPGHLEETDLDKSRIRKYGELTAHSYASPGLVGLQNIGNTCFLNAIIQCLSNTIELKNYIVSGEYISDIHPKATGLFRTFATLIKQLWDKEQKVISTRNLKMQMQEVAPRYGGNSQEDAQEFLRYLLCGLHEEINRVRVKPRESMKISDSLSDDLKGSQFWNQYQQYDNSKIIDIFVGQMKSTLMCTECRTTSTTFEVFWDLSLPLPDNYSRCTLQRCLEMFTKEEILDGQEMPTCSKCKKKTKCVKSLLIQKLPQILVLHLKRYVSATQTRKLSTRVEYPQNNLNMAPFMGSSKGSNSIMYELYAVANHSGTGNSGHYVAICKQPESTSWHQYNDSRVTPISNKSVASSDAYLLFYRRQDDVIKEESTKIRKYTDTL